jgi:hypothetical protein
VTLPSNRVQIQGLGVQSADDGNTFVQWTSNFTTLREFVGLDGMTCEVAGAASPGDGGQGIFYWNGTAAGPDNNSTVIVPEGVIVGAWIRNDPVPASPPPASAVAFRAELINGNVNVPMGGPTGPNVLVDTAIFDTVDGFAVVATPGVYNTLGDVSVYTIKTAGIYEFHLQLYFQVGSGQSTADPVNIYLDVEWMNSTGTTVKYSFGSNSTGGLAKYSPSSEGTNQFSCDLAFTVNAEAGDFFIPFVDDQTGVMYANLSLIAGFNTAFEAFLIGTA